VIIERVCLFVCCRGSRRASSFLTAITFLFFFFWLVGSVLFDALRFVSIFCCYSLSLSLSLNANADLFFHSCRCFYIAGSKKKMMMIAEIQEVCSMSFFYGGSKSAFSIYS